MRQILTFGFSLMMAVSVSAVPSHAQENDAPATAVELEATEELAIEEPTGEGLATLRFINPRARIALPEPMPGPVIRFVVADDFPPFAFIDGAGRLSGVHIDLIRGLCGELDLPCTIQARRFDRVLDAVEEDPDNLVIAAGLAINRDTADQFSFSLPYYRFAARFVALAQREDEADWLESATFGAVENTAHAAFLRDAFADLPLTTYADQDALMAALQAEEISHAFADGLNLAFWLSSPSAGGCCTFVGQPIFSVRYFGEGLAFAVPNDQLQLVQALNAGLIRLEGSGELEAIMLTSFPLDPLGL